MYHVVYWYQQDWKMVEILSSIEFDELKEQDQKGEIYISSIWLLDDEENFIRELKRKEVGLK